MSDAELINEELDGGWDEKDWVGLLYSIKYKQCTPFLGAGACAEVLPLGSDIAQALARKYNYPFQDTRNLPRVAQYIAVEVNPMIPKFEVIESFKGKGPPDYTNLNEPHRVVADLDLPVYITTNYDDFMVKALNRDVPKRTPRRETCKWYMARRTQKSASDPEFNFDLDFDPTPDVPVVFHLHGRLDKLESIVLTEDDYLDFLMYISEERQLIPPRIEEAFTNSALLFMGYSLEDMNFKVLFRKLADYMRRNESARHVSVQLAPKENESTEEQVKRALKQREYLEKHFDLQKVKVYWGTCEEFAKQLRARWEVFNRG